MSGPTLSEKHARLAEVKKKCQRRLSKFAEDRLLGLAKSKGWPLPLQPRHLREVLRSVPDALWSPTVRDLIAESVTVLQVPVHIIGDEMSGVDSHFAPLKSFPRIIRKVAAPSPVQLEALAALKDVAAFLENPPGEFDLLMFDEGVKERAKEKEQPFLPARIEAAGSLGCTYDAYMKELQREKKRERS